VGIDVKAVWSFLVEGGALAILAVLILHVLPKMLDKRVDALNELADKWVADREKDRAEHAREVSELAKAVESAASRISAAICSKKGGN